MLGTMTPNPRELYASHIRALVILMKPGWKCHPPVRDNEMVRRAAREVQLMPVSGIEERQCETAGSRKAPIEGAYINETNELCELRFVIPNSKGFDRKPFMLYSSLYDSPLAGSLSWLLPGARKPPFGRFSHFRGPIFSRSPCR